MNSREGFTLNPLSRRAPSTGLGDASSDVPLAGRDDDQDYPDKRLSSKVGIGLAGRVGLVPCNLAGIDGGRSQPRRQCRRLNYRGPVDNRSGTAATVVDQGTEP